MAESSRNNFDAKRTVVVSNFPADTSEEELTIHFQKEKNGGGDVEEVVVDGNIAFVILICLKVWSVLHYLNFCEYLYLILGEA